MKRFVFVGAGHSHLKAIPVLAAQGSRVELTLITDRKYFTYSGLVPAVVAGDIADVSAQLDLTEFCRAYSVKFQLGELDSIFETHLELKDGTVVYFDACSINIGSQTQSISFDQASSVTNIKPLQKFMNEWNSFRKTIAIDPRPIAVLGGGAAGIEIACAIKTCLQKIAAGNEVHLFTAEKELLPSNEDVGVRLRYDLKKRDLKLHFRSLVLGVEDSKLKFAADLAGCSQSFCLVVNCTGASSALLQSRVEQKYLTTDGFLKINAQLQVLGFKNVFAVGDCAEFTPFAISKSGVHAVRQGRVLAKNLVQISKDQRSFEEYKPPKRQMYLVMTDSKSARMIWGRFSVAGHWVYALKRWIDLRYLSKLRSSILK